MGALRELQVLWQWQRPCFIRPREFPTAGQPPPGCCCLHEECPDHKSRGVMSLWGLALVVGCSTLCANSLKVLGLPVTPPMLITAVVALCCLAGDASESGLDHRV